MIWDLKYWSSPEWETVNGRLDYLSKLGHDFSPTRDKMFASLEGSKSSDIRVVIVGQDPYPNPRFATGRAFEVPASVTPDQFPPTLRSIFREYSNDLSLPYPSLGDLSRWCDQGVLLWNSIPSTTAHQSLSHDWREYDPLTREVLSICDSNGCVFAFLGAVARRHVGCISPTSRVIETSHPSPRGSLNSRTPFVGSRVFSTINQRLVELSKQPIDWQLP